MKGLRKIARFIKRRPVLVVWVDSGGQGGWAHDTEDLPEPMEIWTLGWLIKKKKHHFVVSASATTARSYHAQSNGPIAIPRAAVKDWCYLDTRGRK